MLFGSDTFTNFHVAISLVGIATGIIVLLGMVGGARLPLLTAIFLLSTIGTSATGFGFPFTQILPSHIVGAISLVLLTIAVYALYGAKLAGRWRAIYVVTATASLFLNVFVLIVQLFQKIPTLNALAPTQSETPFLIAQILALSIFAGLAAAALRRFG